MKRTILILVLALTSLSFGQKIEMEKVFGGYKFTQNEKQLSFGEVVNALNNNAEAYQLAKSAKSNYVLSQIISGAGGFLIGWPLGTALAGGKPNWTLAGIGAGLVVVSIPITSGANKKIKKAVDIYNAGFGETSMYHFKPQYHLVFNDKGFGIAMRF